MAWPALALPAAAGTISMQVTCQAQGTNLQVRFENRGDEAARNVQAIVEFEGRTIESAPVQMLEPNRPVVKMLSLPSPRDEGRYAAVVTVLFEDLNAYPFSSVTVQSILIGEARAPELVAALTGGDIHGSGKLTLKVRNAGATDVTVDLRMATARELVASVTPATLAVAAGGQSEATVELENFSALVGSRYPVHALIAYESEGRRNLVTASASVQMLAEQSTKSLRFWVVMLALAVMVGLAVAGFMGRSGRG